MSLMQRLSRWTILQRLFSKQMCEPPLKVAKIMPESMTNGDFCTEDIVTSNGDCTVAEKNEKQNGASVNGASKGKKRPSEENMNGETQTNGTEAPSAAQNGFHYKDDSVLMIKMLSNEATLPTRGSLHAAGYDLYSAVECEIPAKGKSLVSTQVAITVPYGSYGRIAPRSGLALKNFIDVGAGVIDRDYTGEVGVLLFNFSDTPFKVEKKQRIAQLVIEKIFLPQLQVVEELPKTDRGATGYGASGKF